MSETPKPHQDQLSAIDVRAILWRIRHEEGFASDVEIDNAIQALDALVHQTAELIREKGNLEEQYERLQHIVECADTPLMRDVLAERDGLKEQVETLRELNGHVIRERDERERDLERLGEQLETAQKREAQAEREAAALLGTMKAREAVIDRLRLELAEAKRGSNPASEQEAS